MVEAVCKKKLIILLFHLRQNEARAERLAREIEGNTDSLANVELENGDDEEAKFSAVVRETNTPSELAVLFAKSLPVKGCGFCLIVIHFFSL